MQMSPSRRRRVIGALGVTCALGWGLPQSVGQLKAGPASVSLVARLESVSITARLSNDLSCITLGHRERHVPSISVAVSSFLPSNRTMVRIIENNRELIAQAAVESKRTEGSGQRLDIARVCESSAEQEPENQQRKVVIVVEAF